MQTSNSKILFSFFLFINPLTPKSDQNFISPYNITLESNIRVTRIKEMITNWCEYSSLDEFLNTAMAHVTFTLVIPKCSCVNPGWVLGLSSRKTDTVDNRGTAYPGRCAACVTASVVAVFHKLYSEFGCDSKKPGDWNSFSIVKYSCKKNQNEKKNNWTEFHGFSVTLLRLKTWI